MLTIRSRTPRGALFRLVVLVALLVATTPGGSVANPQATGNGAADVYGTVLEAGSASPIENTVVTIWYFGHDGPGGPTWSETVYANAEGAYVFDDVPAGKDDEPRFSIQAYADGYATGNSENFAFNESTGPVEVPDIFLDPAELTVFGAVLDADTLDPVPGASVSLFAEEWGDSRHADDNGEFRFYGTPANLEFTVGVWAWGYDWNEWGPFEYDGVDPLDVGAFHLQQGIPTPHFNVNPHDHDIWGHEWQANVELQITVDPVGGEDQHGTTAHTDEHGDFHLWYSTTPVDLSPGDLVTVSHGDTVKTHIVTSLAITGVDVAADTVSGVAEPGTHVNVGIHLDDEWVNRDVVAEDGTWTADFSADYDIVPGTSGWSSQSDDEGDGTFANWHFADPHFNVNPHDNGIWGHEWQAHAEIDVSVDGSEGLADFTTHANEWGDFDLWDLDGYDIVAGDVVTVTDGVTIKVHVVTALVVTDVDVHGDTVSGSAEPGSWVDVWVNDGPGDTVQSAGDGTWTADFSGRHDIGPGSDGGANQSDEDGDATFIGWRVVNPHFNVNPHDNGIWGHEWPEQVELDVSVDGSEGLANFTAHTNEWGDFDVDTQGYDIVAGDVVTVTGGVTIKVHVVTALVVTDVDVHGDTVSGSAEPGSWVDVWVNDGPGDTVQSAGDGTWTADFSGRHDIGPGSDGGANQRDEDGDATFIGWRVVNPHFNVNPHDNGIWGHEWPAHAELDVSVDGSEGLADFTAHANEWGDFDLWDLNGYDIVAGDVVAVTDGVTLKEHVVTGLQVWEVDAASDTVSGYAEPGSDVWVNIHEEDGPQRWLTAHETTGEWTADFSAAVGDEPWEHAFDIVLGTHGNAEQFDSDNDGTVINWSIDNDPPEAADDHYQTEWNTTLTVHAPGVLENDFDADGDMLIAHLFALPMNGTVVLGSDGSFIYTPDFGFTGTDWFSYKAFDGMDHSGMATVTIEVTLPQLATIEIQHDAAGVVFDRWVTGYSSAYSGGGYVYGQWTDTELSIRFSGTTVRWIGPMQPAYGMADIYVDGVLVASDVDCYAPAEDATLEAVIWESDELDGGPHTLTVRLTGNRNPASTGNVVVVDRFEVDGVDPGGGGVRFDERAGTFSGTWIDANNSTYYDTTYSYSRWTNASFTFEFEGTRVAWIGPMTPFYGTAEIWLDGSYVETVDAYRAYQGWRGRIWESETLTPGTHTLEIRPTGEKNPASTAANIVIDAIDVMP